MSKTSIYLLVVLLLVLLGGGGYYFFKVRPANELSEDVPLTQPADTPAGAAGGSGANATPGAAGDAATPGAGADANGATSGADSSAPGASTGAVPGADGVSGGNTAGAAGAGSAAPGSSVNIFASGTFSGNTSYGVTIASKVGALASKRKLTFAVDVQLLPAASGRVTKRPEIVKYQQLVTGAAMRLEADELTAAEVKRSPAPAQRKIVANFLGLLKSEFPNANTSVSIVGPDDRVLAIGDRSSSGTLVVKLG